MSGDPAERLFRRLVIALPGLASSRTGLAAAARLAQAFGSELLGLTLEDTGLTEWSGSSVVRHYSRTSTVLGRVPPERLAADLAAAARIARARLLDVAAPLGIAVRFEADRAASLDLDRAVAMLGDLFGLVEPADPLARSSLPFTGLIEAAARSSAPVLYVPHAAVERPGPVAVIVREEERAIRAFAERVAGTLHESLVSIAPGGGDLPVPGRVPGERLLVLSRRCGAAGDLRTLVAFLHARRAPVLIVGAPVDAGETGRPDRPPA